MQKAYKLLSQHLGISNGKAKSLIDKGLVSVNGKKIVLARTLLPDNARFEVIEIKKPTIIFEDENILCVEKPPFIESYDLCEYFPSWSLLHRLDKETSGVILLTKAQSEFSKKAKEEFKHQQVVKFYHAVVSGIVSQAQEINLPILTTKGKSAKSKISSEGLSAFTYIEPLAIVGKKSLIKAQIKTGRTHQIRVHLKAINHPIVGDTLYGGIPATRLMLHASYIKIFEYEFTSALPKEFELYC